MYGDGKGKISFDVLKEAWGLVPMEKTFTDIKDGEWYYSAVLEAARDGIIVGYEDSTFRPDNGLTRAEYAVMWQRMKTFFQKMIEASK